MIDESVVITDDFSAVSWDYDHENHQPQHDHYLDDTDDAQFQGKLVPQNVSCDDNRLTEVYQTENILGVLTFCTCCLHPPTSSFLLAGLQDTTRLSSQNKMLTPHKCHSLSKCARILDRQAFNRTPLSTSVFFRSPVLIGINFTFGTSRLTSFAKLSCWQKNISTKHTQEFILKKKHCVYGSYILMGIQSTIDKQLVGNQASPPSPPSTSSSSGKLPSLASSRLCCMLLQQSV